MGWGNYVTNRQHKALIAWLDAQWNIPTKDNYYQARLTAQVASLFSKGIKLEDFIIKFNTKQPSKDISKESKDKQTREMLLGVFGFDKYGNQVRDLKVNRPNRRDSIKEQIKKMKDAKP